MSLSNSLVNDNKIKSIVIAGILTAFSLIIPLFPFKLPLPQPFSVTLAAHVPTLVAMFFSPWVAVCTVIGSTIGFFISLGPIVAIRAASHIVFAVAGAYMLRKKMNAYLVFAICAVLHGAAEAASVYLFGPLCGFPDSTSLTYLFETVFCITVFHHVVDCIISVVLLIALEKAKFLKDTGILPRRRAKQ